MVRSWSGFLPQNELVRLQWAALESVQTDGFIDAPSVAALEEPEDDDLDQWLTEQGRRGSE